MSTSLPDRNAHYWQTITHLQKGEWDDALRGLEQLLVQHPEDQRLRRTLEDVRYKAHLDSESRVRIRRWIFPHQKWIDRIALGFGLFVLMWMGAAFAYQQSTLNAARTEQIALHESWLHEAELFISADDFASAEQRLNRILADDPSDTNARVKLATVRKERDLLYRYQEAVAKQITGDCLAALKIFAEIRQVRADYRDLAARTADCNQQAALAQFLDDAAKFERDGRIGEAIRAYEESRKLGASALADGTEVAAKLASLYLKTALTLLAAGATDQQQLQQAQSLFASATQADPQNLQASAQAQLLNRYLVGRSALESKDWSAAVSNLRMVYETKSDYLGGSAVSLLYNAYIGLGDGYRTSGDCALALQRYSSAAALPVADTSLAQSRSNLAECGTQPNTIAVELTPPAIEIPESTNALDSETIAVAAPSSSLPAISLSTLHNRIVFKSSNQAQPGFWAMDGDGNNRQFLGGLGDAGLSGQYNALLSSYRISPDGEFQVFVGEVYEKSQVFIGRLDRAWPDRPLTTLTGIAYDPQWSPINGAIVFVSQEDGSDDIWFIGADGESQHSLVRNTWEWDKNPTWSPDGSRIAFWSNRTGLKQIFVMNNDGKEQQNISNTGWDEYEPLWVR